MLGKWFSTCRFCENNYVIVFFFSLISNSLLSYFFLELNRQAYLEEKISIFFFLDLVLGQSKYNRCHKPSSLAGIQQRMETDHEETRDNHQHAIAAQ